MNTTAHKLLSTDFLVQDLGHDSIQCKTIAEYICMWGGSASITLLDPACQIFKCPHIPGIIGYRLESGCAVVFGDPVCADEDKGRLAHAFHEYCKQNKWGSVYVTASKPFTDWAMKNLCGASIEIGEDLIFDPFQDPKQGSKGRLLRGKVSQAKRCGVSVKEYRFQDSLLEHAIEQVGFSWLEARKGPQIYLAHVHLFAERTGKRWFYAIREGRVIGVVLLNQLQARKGWLIQLLMTTPEAPNGTSELLVTSVIEALRAEDCRFLAFGVAQSDALGEIVGLSRISTWFGRIVFRMAKKIFSLDGRRKYWKKYHPESERSFLVFGGSRITLKEVLGVMRALNVSI